MDFNFFIEDMGEFLTVSKKTYVNPIKCEGLTELYNTMNHETYHKIFDCEDIDIDDSQEHHLVRMMAWMEDIY